MTVLWWNGGIMTSEFMSWNEVSQFQSKCHLVCGKTMENLGKTMENHGKPWKTMENHGKPMENLHRLTSEHPGYFHQSLDIDPQTLIIKFLPLLDVP